MPHPAERLLTDDFCPEPAGIPGESGAPLSICLLGYRSNPYSGGQGIYMKYLSRALVDAGHRVDVISGEPYPDLDPRVRLIKLPGLNLFEADDHVTALRWHHLTSWTDFFEWFSMLTGGFPEPYTFGRRLVRYFRQHRPVYDIVHDNQSLCYGLLALERQGIPVATTVHHPITSDRDIALAAAPDWKARLLIRRWYSFLDMQERVVRRLGSIVTVSDCSRRDIAAAFATDINKISVVPNGIDTTTFRPLPEMTRKPLRIMSTASADAPLKGLDYLLRAVGDVAIDHPGIELHVVGKLKPEGSTAQLLDALGLGDRVVFESGISTDRMVEKYAESSIAVVPSVYEGFGLPAGEAMACGVPVIATDGGALPEVVGDAGITVPVRDHAAIARAIRDLIGSEAERQRLGAAGRERVLNEFDWSHAARRMVRHYRDVMAASEQPARAARTFAA